MIVANLSSKNWPDLFLFDNIEPSRKGFAPAPGQVRILLLPDLPHDLPDSLVGRKPTPCFSLVQKKQNGFTPVWGRCLTASNEQGPHCTRPREVRIRQRRVKLGQCRDYPVYLAFQYSRVDLTDSSVKEDN